MASLSILKELCLFSKQKSNFPFEVRTAAAPVQRSIPSTLYTHLMAALTNTGTSTFQKYKNLMRKRSSE